MSAAVIPSPRDSRALYSIFLYLTPHITESAILATYRMTLTHLNVPHKPQYTNIVQIYHPSIWNKLKSDAQASQPPQPYIGRPKTVSLLQDHIGFPKDAHVIILQTFKGFYDAKFKDMSGRVMFTIKQSKWWVCVSLDDQSARDEVKRFNQQPKNRSTFDFLKDDQLDILCCKIGQVKLLPLHETNTTTDEKKDKSDNEKHDKPADEAGIKDSKLLGKRKASEHSATD